MITPIIMLLSFWNCPYHWSYEVG